HCGDVCNEMPFNFEEHCFWCNGCQTVYQILQNNGLCTYYDLNENAGISLKATHFEHKYNYLSEPKIQKQLLQFESEKLNKITFFIPAVHCSSCVWLLENFQKIKAGVYSSRLNFIKKELAVSYNPTVVTLKEIVELLITLGYEPSINLQSSERTEKSNKKENSLIFKIGVVGFCFGNIMLLSFPEYFNMDLNDLVDVQYQRFFLYLNFGLSLPVFFYGASSYLVGAWRSLKEFFGKQTNVMSVDIPIALGVIALFGRSFYETFVNQSAGYWDSLAGLVFFLLLGKWVQNVTFNFLSFNRDYKSYFPLAVEVVSEEKATYKNVSELVIGDKMVVRNEEIIPADAILIKGEANIDYSFVTGESATEAVKTGELIYAGGRQIGKQIELLVKKPVSQSYLTQLWNDQPFEKDKYTPTTELANLFSKYFTFITLTIAIGTGIFWWFVNPDKTWISMTAILMVACPCALTLSMPFTMNTVMAIFGRNKLYVKNQGVIQLMNEIDTVVFDKTGTLTKNSQTKVLYEGEELSTLQKQQIVAVLKNSNHPLSRMVASHLVNFQREEAFTISGFEEIKGNGLIAKIDGKEIKLGSAEFVVVLENSNEENANVHVQLDGKYYGKFVISSRYRKNWREVLGDLKKRFELILLSGDNAGAKTLLQPYFGESNLHFQQKPGDKLQFIKSSKNEGRNILMIGDGLNDAGALRQSQIGIALSDDAHSFTPACDAILEAKQFHRLPDFLRFSQISLRTVKASLVLSLVYNAICISWAATGNLSPVFAAIFMPLSTISVVLFAVGLTYLYAYQMGFLTNKVHKLKI
ncbi:MAG: heavy metal translocating P-type ATPase metal-binding domain-containing protein, partial [Spirosomataceae bacterium]